MIRRAIERFESSETDLADEARMTRELRAAADRHREILRRSWEIMLNDKQVRR